MCGVCVCVQGVPTGTEININAICSATLLQDPAHQVRMIYLHLLRGLTLRLFKKISRLPFPSSAVADLCLLSAYERN